MIDGEDNGDLPAGWLATTMGAVAEVVGGGTPKTKVAGNFSDVQGHPWLTPADLTGHTEKMVSRGRRFLTDQGLATSAAKYMPAGTILFSSRAPIGYVAIASNPLTTNQGFRSFVPSAALDPSYAYHYLKSITAVAEQLASGTTFNELSGSKAKTLPLPLAPLAEQRRIAARLDEFGVRRASADAHLQRARALLERQRSAVLAAACDGRLTRDLRDSSDEETEGPFGWTRETVGSLAAAWPRSIQSGPFGSNLKHSEFQNTGKLVIGIDNVLDGEFSFGSQHRISDRKFEELKRYEARPRDVLITVMATVGRVCVVPADIEPAIITKHVYRITADEQRVLPEFLALALRGHRTVREQIRHETRGQTRPGINGQIVKSLVVALPPRDEQNAIVTRVNALLASASHLSERMGRCMGLLDAASRAALSKAFRGELVPTEASLAAEEGRDLEPAEKLLARVLNLKAGST